jgi:hypothetical protein
MTPVGLLQPGVVRHLSDPPVGDFHSDQTNLSDPAYCKQWDHARSPAPWHRLARGAVTGRMVPGGNASGGDGGGG